MVVRLLWLLFFVSWTSLQACEPVVFQCTTNAQCPAALPHCLAGLCRICRSSSDCPEGRPCIDHLCQKAHLSEVSTETIISEPPSDTTQEVAATERTKESFEHARESAFDGSPESSESPQETTVEGKGEALLERPSEVRPEPSPEALPEPRPEPSPEPRPEPPPEPQPEPQPERPPESGCPSLCPGGFACQGGQCVSSCSQDSHCHPGFVCKAGVCYATATASAPNQPLQWADGRSAIDCLAYLRGEDPTALRSYGYLGSAASGIYLIQPLRVASPFAVHCDMTTEGGGWTLVLKADGSKQTFAYDAPLWLNPNQGPGIDATPTLVEALLPSYTSNSMSQMLLVFHDTNGRKGTPLVLEMDAPSLASLIQSGDTHTFQSPVTSASWRTVLSGSSFLSNCEGHGINLQATSINFSGSSLRLGAIGFDSNSNCQREFSAWVGIGSKFDPQFPRPPGFPTAGHYYGPPTVTPRSLPAFGFVYVRDLRGRNFWFSNNKALQSADGFVPPDCLHLSFLGGPWQTDAIVWLRPPNQTSPYASLCQNSVNDGGWSLLLKADGTKDTFAYDRTIWTNPSSSLSEPSFSTTEAILLGAYKGLPFRQILVQMTPFPIPPSPTPSAFSSLVVPVRAESFESIIKSTSEILLASPLGEAAWKGLIQGSTLQSVCRREGFNLRSYSSSARLYRMRFGIFADGSSSCSTPDSAIGFGLEPTLSNPRRTPIGNLNLSVTGASQETPAMGILSLRDLAAAPASSNNSDIVLTNRNGVAARERHNGTWESSCRAYRYPPHYKGAAAQSGLYRLQSRSSSSSFYLATCDQDTDGGGWTLALKADGTKQTFTYRSTLWNNSNLLSIDQPHLDRNEAKLESFVSVGFSEIMIQMLPASISDISQRGSLRVRHRGVSLRSLFESSRAILFERGVGRGAWKALFPQTSLQRRFSIEGINLEDPFNGPLVRIGLISNNEVTDRSSDSYLGLGGNGLIGPSVGNLPSTIGPDNGSVPTAAFGWLWVR